MKFLTKDCWVDCALNNWAVIFMYCKAAFMGNIYKLSISQN